MSLREHPVIRHSTLPDGADVDVRVVVPDEPSIRAEEPEHVVVELERNGEPVGVVETHLSADDIDGALFLGDRITAALEAGAVEPTAEGIERLALLTPPA